ncbi:MAG TPA: GNAT family N-acetyltransferase [Jatrophihabitantaceae bacterium]|nr:GNAT family N-acetyltransferase [Jatrophihabitantaceae bacterium]
MHAVRPTGQEYLALVTELLQRQRVADPVAGLWEAADLQWWYTRDPHPHDADAVAWVDGEAPVTAAVFTRWSESRYGCDVLGDPTLSAAWDFVHNRCAELAHASIEMEVDATCPVSAAEAARAGFTEPCETYAVNWLDAADRAAARALPVGYTLVARPRQYGPHPMIGRNGADVEARLRSCSLYDPELDLALLTDDGAFAGYAMFWADRRTRVGLVEPMRIEDMHSGRGLAGTLLRAGLDALAARGCDRFKVTNDRANPAAERAYLGAGFRAHQHVTAYRLVRPTGALWHESPGDDGR